MTTPLYATGGPTEDGRPDQDFTAPAPAPSMAALAAFTNFVPRQVQPVPFARLRDEVIALYTYPQRAKKTCAKMRQTLGHVADLLPPDALTDALTPDLVTKFIASRPEGESNNTTLSLLRPFSAVCSYAMKMGYLYVSPFLIRRHWLPVTKTQFRQHYSRAEIQHLLAKAKEEISRKRRHSQAGPGAEWKARRLYAVVATVAYTGLRKNEALRLKSEDVDLENKWIHVIHRPGAMLKTLKSERSVPIPPPLLKILREWVERNDRPGEWFFPNSTGDQPWIFGGPGYRPLDRLHALGKRAGIPDLTFLGLRHSFASHAHSAWGFTSEQIAKYMGHSNKWTQDAYIHEDTSNLRHKSPLIRFDDDGPAADPADLPAARVSWAPPRKSDTAPDQPPRIWRTNRAKLTDEQALECRQLRLHGWKYDALAARYGMSKVSISYVVRGKTYKHVPFPEASR